MKNLFGLIANLCDELDMLFNAVLFKLVSHVKMLISDVIDMWESRK